MITRDPPRTHVASSDAAPFAGTAPAFPNHLVDAVLRRLAVSSLGASGADIERSVREARQKARREKRSLTYSDIEAALHNDKVRLPENLRRIAAVHEAGHVVARHNLHCGSVQYVTIRAGCGGFVESRPQEDAAQTDRFHMAEIAAVLAGRAAEEVILGEVTSGSGWHSQSDLAKATELAFALETACGFSKELPLLYRLSGDIPFALRMSPDLARKVNARLEAAYAMALNIVRDHRPLHGLLVDALLAAGALDRDDLDAILDKEP